MNHDFPSGANIALCIIEFIVFLACIALGSWVGGIGVGFFGALGVAIFGFGFQMAPGEIAFDVIQIIMSAVCIIAAVQVAGGMDYLVALINRALRKAPRLITICAPIITYLMTVLAGTGHTCYSALPVIIDVAKEFNIRPCQPLAAAVVSAQMGITASPISAAVVWLGKNMEDVRGVSYMKVLSVSIPATFIGAMVCSVCCIFLMGKPLYTDPEFLQRVADGRCVVKCKLPPDVMEKVLEIRRSQLGLKDIEGGALPPECLSTSLVEKRTSYVSSDSSEDPVDVEKPLRTDGAPPRPAWHAPTSLLIFAVGIVAVMVYALLISESLNLFTPVVGRDAAITSILLSFGGLICVICRVQPRELSTCPVFISGMVGCVCVLGVAWMGDTFIKYWMDGITEVAGNVLVSQPWTLAIILFVGSALMYSQAATAKPLIPIAFQAGVPNAAILAAFPAVSALFVLPTYPTLLAAVLMDDTGSTKVGKYVFDHTMFLPGVIAIVSAVAVGFGLAYAYAR